MYLIKTLPKRWHFLAITVFSYSLWPIVEIIYHYENLKRGVYPVNGDSIAIPIAMTAIIWLLCIPLFAYLVRVCYKKHREGLSFFVLPISRPVPILISSLSLVIISLMIQEIYMGVIEAHYFSIINGIVQIWFCLYLRAVLCDRVNQ